MIAKIGLDLGYANITLSTVADDIYREESVVLLDPVSRRLLSVGNSAVEGRRGNTAVDGILMRPFKNGLLYSSDLTREVIRHALRIPSKGERIRCIIALPSNMIPKQEQEIFKMLSDAGVSECFAVNPAVAALVGAGYSPTINVISVNIGASHTEIAIFHGGQVIKTVRAEIGGENFDIAVKEYIHRHGDLTVSLHVARTIKERLGAVWPGKGNESIDIQGTLSLTGNEVRMSISTEDIVGVFEEPMRMLINAIVDATSKLPRDIASDIWVNGIVISGGGAELFGIDTLIGKVLDIPVKLPLHPIDCVSKGLARINAFMPSRMRTNNKNLTDKIAKMYEASKDKKTNGDKK